MSMNGVHRISDFEMVAFAIGFFSGAAAMLGAIALITTALHLVGFLRG